MKTNENRKFGHIPHIEELLITNNSTDLLDILSQFMINGYISTTVKLDGSPCIFLGKENGIPFVATKSIFNKTPKVLYSLDDIEHIKDIGLRFKMQKVFSHLIDHAPDNIILQGDLLWCYTNPNKSIHMNTLVYVPAGSYVDYLLGIYWHTAYSGSLDKLTRVNDRNIIKELNKIDSPNVKNLYPKEQLIPYHEYSEVLVPLLTKVAMFVGKYQYQDLDINIQQILQRYINHVIRTKSVLGDSYIDILQFYIDAGYSDLSEHYKTIASAPYYSLISDILRLTNLFWEFKSKIVPIYDKFDPYVYNNETETFIKTKHEGLIISTDKYSVKLVDRREFSYYNFSDKYKKAWTKNAV